MLNFIRKQQFRSLEKKFEKYTGVEINQTSPVAQQPIVYSGLIQVLTLDL